MRSSASLVFIFEIRVSIRLMMRSIRFFDAASRPEVSMASSENLSTTIASVFPVQVVELVPIQSGFRGVTGGVSIGGFITSGMLTNTCTSTRESVSFLVASMTESVSIFSHSDTSREEYIFFDVRLSVLQVPDVDIGRFIIESLLLPVILRVSHFLIGDTPHSMRRGEESFFDI